MAYESWMPKKWYLLGLSAAVNGRWWDMTEAWQAQKGKPKIPGKRVDAQETFYLGYNDGMLKRDKMKRNPSKSTKAVIPTTWKKAKVRRLPGGRVQVKFYPGRSSNPKVSQAGRHYGVQSGPNQPIGRMSKREAMKLASGIRAANRQAGNYSPVRVVEVQ